MRLLAITDTAHYLDGGRLLCGWEAALREIETLADVADEVRSIACLHPGPPPPSAVESAKVRTTLLDPSGGPSFIEKCRAAAKLPGYARVIARELDWADAVYVRGPSSVTWAALLLLAARRAPEIRWVRYAGEWRGRPEQALSYRWQKKLLRSGAVRAAVGVSDLGSAEPEWVHRQPNPSLSERAWQEAGLRTEGKRLSSPLKLLFAGRLDRRKGAHTAIEVVAALRARGVSATLDVAGDGPERADLGRLAADLGVRPAIGFCGQLGREALNELYAEAHFVLLPSASEGWPKALTEAMAHGAVPVASAVGAIPYRLSRHMSGAALASRDPSDWADAVLQIAGNERLWRAHADNARVAAAELTYESFRDFAVQMLSFDRSTGRPLPMEASA